jgi:isoleucyl-tRNA synthetase
MFEIDKWAMQQLQKLTANVIEAYDNFVFHRVFSLIYNFCTVEMSSIYMDVLKDRMYCDSADSLSRRSAQTAMYNILDCMIRMLGPVLVHTAEGAWDVMEYKSQDVESVHLADMPKVDASIDFEGDEPRWQKLMGLRDEVLRILEGLRQEKKIASNQQACVTVCCDDEDAAFLNEFGLEQFAALCIVSEVKIVKTTGETTIAAEKSSYTKCERCWNYWPSVGSDSDHPDLCERCVTVVRSACSEKA